jgi:hypothetical protein
MASVYEAWIKFKGDIQHHWSCDLMKSRISPGYAGNQEKCTCGGWELVAAIESAEAAERERDTYKAQVGALRGALIDKTINTCGLITRGLAKGLGYPERIEGKCEGYTCGPDDDEPHDMCKECIAAYDPEAEYSAALAERGADNE